MRRLQQGHHPSAAEGIANEILRPTIPMSTGDAFSSSKYEDSTLTYNSSSASAAGSLISSSVMSQESHSASDNTVRPSTSATANTPSRIAFGSCNDQDRQNNLWPIIESRKPAAFVWGGDAIYADIEHQTDFSTWPPTPPRVECATPDRVRRLYRNQRAVPGYASLISSNVTIFGTIDDHDFGCDNADKYYPHKHETTNAFVEFLEEPQESIMAKRAVAGHGVYGVKLFDFERPEGAQLVPESQACIDPDFLQSLSATSSTCVPEYSNKTVAVFVLDVRTNKDPWLDGSSAYFENDYVGDFLGERQWQWFEAAIAHSQASVNVVVNGLQVNSKIFPNPNIAENWGSFPRSQQRLYDAILGPSVQAPLLISGDVHMTQMMRKDCRKRVNKDSSIQRRHQRPVMELTTSGMTHSWGRVSTPHLNVAKNPAQHRLRERMQSIALSFTMHVMHQVSPWNSLLKSGTIPTATSGLTDDVMIAMEDETNARKVVTTHDGGIENAKQGLQYSLDRNFGELEFDWEERTVTIRAIGEDVSAPPLLAAKVSMDQLSGQVPMHTSWVTDRDFEREEATNPRYDILDGDWICIEHRGPVSAIGEIMGHLTVISVVGALSVLPFVLPSMCLGLLRRRKTSLATSSKSHRRSNSSRSIGRLPSFSRNILPRMLIPANVDDNEVSSMDSFLDKSLSSSQ